MMALAIVVIASMVSVRGLGIEVLDAVTNQYLAKGLFNGLVVAAFAITYMLLERNPILSVSRLSSGSQALRHPLEPVVSRL